MTWNLYRRRYEITSTYDERETIKRAGNMRWDPAFKVWFTEAKATAMLFGPVMDEVGKAELARTDPGPVSDFDEQAAEMDGPTEEFNRCWEAEANPPDPRVKSEQTKFPFEEEGKEEGKEGG